MMLQNDEARLCCENEQRKRLFLADFVIPQLIVLALLLVVSHGAEFHNKRIQSKIDGDGAKDLLPPYPSFAFEELSTERRRQPINQQPT